MGQMPSCFQTSPYLECLSTQLTERPANVGVRGVVKYIYTFADNTQLLKQTEDSHPSKLPALANLADVKDAFLGYILLL
jgi:hypothetical protein